MEKHHINSGLMTLPAYKEDYLFKTYLSTAPLFSLIVFENINEIVLPIGPHVCLLLALKDNLYVNWFTIGLNLSSKIEDIDFHHVYIGQTDDLSVEFKNHSQYKCISKFKYGICLYYYETDKENRTNMINDLSQKYPFTCNNLIIP
jgi:hypothetical protein